MCDGSVTSSELLLHRCRFGTRPRALVEPAGARGCMRDAVVSRPLAEEALVERARRGDAGAFEELVVAYQGIAFRTAYLIARDASDAEEAAQDGFVKAYRA